MVKYRYLDAPDGRQIHFAETGSGPAILLLHQTPRSVDEFREVMGCLEGKFRLIAMDLPGMGQSSPLRSLPKIERYADDAEFLLEYLGVDSVTVCGHHTGGVVAMELAARQLEAVDGLVLSSTSWVGEKERAERANSTMMDAAIPSRDGSHLQNLWERRSPHYPEDEGYMQRFIADALKCSNPAAGHLAVGNYKMELAAPKVEVPVLIVHHGKDPFATNHLPALRAAFPDAPCKVIADGHIPLEHTAAEFSAIVGDWIADRLAGSIRLEAVK